MQKALTIDGYHALGASAYFKEHRGSGSDSTLFVVNLPNTATTASLRQVFNQFGEIEAVDLDQPPYRTRCARVIFSERASLKLALAAVEIDDSPLLRREAEVERSVVKRLVTAHEATLPASDALMVAADKCMALFEQEENSEVERRAVLRADGADDDGFITVTHKRKERKETVAPAGKKKKKDLELKNFYRHQIREEKKDKLLELRQRFEEDKARIAKLKEARKFRPY